MLCDSTVFGSDSTGSGSYFGLRKEFTMKSHAYESKDLNFEGDQLAFVSPICARPPEKDYFTIAL